MSEQQIDDRSTPTPERAGFWRRLFGLFIDTILISVPFQIAAIFLYAATGGLIQDTSGITFNKCQPVTHLSIKVNPGPPAQPNFAKECWFYSFGFETGRILVVGRVTKEGTLTKTISQTYSIGADGRQIKAFSLDPVAMFFLFIYLILMQALFGATIGQRIVKICVVERDNAQKDGVALKRAFVRNIILLAGAVPPLAVLLWNVIMSGGEADLAFGGHFFLWFGLSMLAAAIWEFWILVQIVQRKDAIHDRIAGTSVVRRFKKPQLETQP